jgi:hypothetical protein
MAYCTPTICRKTPNVSVSYLTVRILRVHANAPCTPVHCDGNCPRVKELESLIQSLEASLSLARSEVPSLRGLNEGFGDETSHNSSMNQEFDIVRELEFARRRVLALEEAEELTKSDIGIDSDESNIGTATGLPYPYDEWSQTYDRGLAVTGRWDLACSARALQGLDG